MGNNIPLVSSISSIDSIANSSSECNEGVIAVPLLSLGLDKQYESKFSNNDLIKKIFITIQDYYINSSDLYDYTKIENPKDQLEKLVLNLSQLNELPSGNKLLNKINSLLGEDKKLIFSFAGEENGSPKCVAPAVTIHDGIGKNKTIDRCLSFIRLPKSVTDSIELKFYSKKQKKVVTVKEPMYVMLGHELIHCIINLSIEKNQSGPVLNALKNVFPNITVLQDIHLRNWVENFFGGSDPSTCFDELQVMILGFQLDDDSRISESQLLSELLSEDYCPHELTNFKGDVLIPCGHLGPHEEPTQEDLKNFTKLLIESNLDIFKGIQPYQATQEDQSQVQKTNDWCLLV